MHLAAINDLRRPLLAEIESIAQQGFEQLDLLMAAPGATLENTDWSAVQATLASNNLKVICQAPAYLPIDNPSPPVRQAALDELRRCVDVAQILGARVCTTRFLGWPAHLSEAAGYEYYRQLYTVLIRHGEERGVQVALENSAQNSHQLKYFREIFHRLPALKLVYNIGHGNIQTAQSLTRDYLFALADRLVHVRLSDNSGQGNERLPFGAPASGGIDLARELRTLRNFNYDSGLTIEVAGDRRWVLASAQLVREAWPEAG